MGGMLTQDSASWVTIESDYNGFIKETTESRPYNERIMSSFRVGFEWEFYEDIYLDMNLGTSFVVWQREQINRNFEFLDPSKSGIEYNNRKVTTYPFTGQFVSNIGIMFKL